MTGGQQVLYPRRFHLQLLKKREQPTKRHRVRGLNRAKISHGIIMDANHVYTINDIAPQSDWQLGTLRGDNKTSSDDARLASTPSSPLAAKSSRPDSLQAHASLESRARLQAHTSLDKTGG